MSPAPIRKSAGTRPSVPRQQDDPPDDYLCTWVFRVAVWSDGPKTGVWELKYINAACSEHARLPAA